jgi:hypothetical protein
MRHIQQEGEKQHNFEGISEYLNKSCYYMFLDVKIDRDWEGDAGGNGDQKIAEN